MLMVTAIKKSVLKISCGFLIGMASLGGNAYAQPQSKGGKSMEQAYLIEDQQETDAGHEFKNDRLHFYAKLTPKPGLYDQLRAAIAKSIPETLAEPGCHVFAIVDNSSDKSALYLFEIFEDEAALQYHLEMQYTKDLLKEISQLLAKPPEVQNMTSTGLFAFRVDGE